MRTAPYRDRRFPLIVAHWQHRCGSACGPTILNPQQSRCEPHSERVLKKPEAMVTRLVLFLMLFCGPALARDDGRYTNSPLKEWFDLLASRKGLCCSVADGMWLMIPTGNRTAVTIESASKMSGLMFRTTPL